jgi:hypothetical protein
MVTVKLSPAQRAAVEIYVTDPAHEEDYPEATLRGSMLFLDASIERAAEILIEAANSADVGDGETADRGARTALENVYAKLKNPRAS